MLKVGVFGVGHLGKFHLNNWKEIPEVELIGFFDPNNEHAQDVEKAYGLKSRSREGGDSSTAGARRHRSLEALRLTMLHYNSHGPR